VGVFVGPDGRVTASMVTTTNGSEVFTEEVLRAVDQWVFGWKVDPGAGRWIEMTWNFRSPYFSGDGGDRNRSW
jgi:outer membrane biosynthesis protein TonB